VLLEELLRFEFVKAHSGTRSLAPLLL
jgi:hypothetical protein